MGLKLNLTLIRNEWEYAGWMMMVMSWSVLRVSNAPLRLSSPCQGAKVWKHSGRTTGHQMGTYTLATMKLEETKA